VSGPPAPAGRAGLRGARGRSGCGVCRTLGVALLDLGCLGGELGAPRCRSLAASRLVDRDLPGTQHVKLLAAFEPGGLDAGGDDETRPALALLLGIARVDRSAFGRDAGIRVGPRRAGRGRGGDRRRGHAWRHGRRARRRRGRARCRRQDTGSDQADEQRRRQPDGRDAADRTPGERRLAHHVSAVSTVRLAAARYSTERISRSRDTVRGNSCASGPSVYSPSGSTAAETMSLTRRS